MPSNHSIIVWSTAHVVANRYPGLGLRVGGVWSGEQR